jgi:alpha-ketoglutarate-dependent taurine dioxygenase
VCLAGIKQDEAMDSITPYQPTTLRGALIRARDFGWHVVAGDLCELADALSDEAGNRQASEPFISVVRSRSSDDNVKVLRAMSKEQAHPRSLSAQYGYEPFPFHTDGAHQQTPPDFMLLAARQDDAGESPTHLKRLWVPPPPADDDDMRRGVFRVDAGRRTFYTTCQSVDGRIRFDPGCMAPIDPRSRRLADAILAGEPDYSHGWTRSGEILIVDNTRVMHARGRVGDFSRRALYRLLLARPLQTMI